MDVDGKQTEKKTGTAPAKTTGKQTGNAPAVQMDDTIGAFFIKHKDQIARAVPKHVTPDRLARISQTAIRMNPKLGLCNFPSLLASVMISAQLGVELNTPLGEAYLIPYGKEAQFQMGYKGLLKLAHNCGQYRQITTNAVDEADEFFYEYGLNPILKHIPADKPSGNIVKYYAVYHLTNGGYDFKVWSHARAEKHGKDYSKSYSNGPWKTNFDQMAQKSVLIDLLRMAPKSIELARATAADNQMFTVNPNDPDLNIDAIETEYQVEE